MQSMIISSPSSLIFREQPGSIVPRGLGNGYLIPTTRNPQVTRRGVVLARRGDDIDGYGQCSGRMVDEDIITLRLRLKELRMSESENEFPLDWMEWEKKYFVGYFQKDVYALIGLLQTLLMNTRPCLALGILTFLALSATTSAGLLLLHGVQVVKGIANVPF